jgi:hypothetical protein
MASTSIERKSGMPHIRDIKGEAVPLTAGLRALDNKGDGILSAFRKVNKMMKYTSYDNFPTSV